MLVHKKSRGVLTYLWNLDGTYLVPATFQNCPYLSPAEWWEVSYATPLGKRVLWFYPDFEPVVDSQGMLIDIRLPQEETRRKKEREEQAAYIAELKRLAEEQGMGQYFNKARRLRGTMACIETVLETRSTYRVCSESLFDKVFDRSPWGTE